jgi:hypothetical protein
MLISTLGVRRFTLIMCVGLLAMACKSGETMTIRTVSGYSTYNTPQPRLLATDSPSMKWVQFQDRIDRELQQQIPEMGLSYSASRPDLSFYVYGLGARLAQEPVLEYQSTGYDINSDRIPRLTGLDHGSLVLDIVDPKNRRLMWRGTVGFPLENAEQAYQTLPEAIRVLLTKGSKALTQAS